MFRWWGGSESPRCLVSWIAKWDVASVASEQELPLKLETFFLISIDGMFIWCLTRANARVNLYLLFCAVGNFDEYQTTNRQSQISIQYLPRAIIRFSKPKIIDRKFWDKKKTAATVRFFLPKHISSDESRGRLSKFKGVALRRKTSRWNFRAEFKTENSSDRPEQRR